MDNIREEENIELKAMREQLQYKEGYLKEKEIIYNHKRRKLKTICIFLCIVFIILMMFMDYLDGIVDGMEGFAALLFSSTIGGMVDDITVVVLVAAIFFFIKHHLYTHVYDEIKIGPIKIGASHNLLSDIKKREHDILLLRNKIDEEYEKSFR